MVDPPAGIITEEDNKALLDAFETYLAKVLQLSNAVSQTPPTEPPVDPPVEPPDPEEPPTGNPDDGSANAPKGMPQLPSALNGYAKRPSWEVAGVDYKVGIPDGTTLKDPKKGGLPAGCSYSATPSPRCNISGRNVVLDGWDFTDVMLTIGGSGGDTPESPIIRHCRFSMADAPAINCAWGKVTNLLVEYCEMYRSNTNEGVINWAPTDKKTPCTLQYCYIKTTGDGPNWKIGGKITLKYNLLHNVASGALSHLDVMVIGDGPQSFEPFTVDYNTIYNDSHYKAGTGSQGIGFNGNAHSTQLVVKGGSFSNNVHINKTTGDQNGRDGITFGLLIETSLTETGTSWNVKNNYIDDSGCGGRGFHGWNMVRNTNYGPQRGQAIMSGNVDMKTGQQPTKWNTNIG